MADGHNSTQCATEQATHYLFLLFPKKKSGRIYRGSAKMQGDCPMGLKSEIMVGKKQGLKAGGETCYGSAAWTRRRN